MSLKSAVQVEKGRKPATLSDVAAQAGVTAATVSFTLSGKRNITPLTREAVMRAVQELGYEPNPHAQRLANGRCDNTIALFSLQLDLGVGTRKLQLIQRALHDRGYAVPIHGYGYAAGRDADDQLRLMGELRRSRPRAVVCNSMAIDEGALGELHRYQDEGGLVVCYDSASAIDCDQVIFDREDNGYQAAHYLVEQGHRKIGFFSIGKGSSPSGERFNGFERALREAGLASRPEWLMSGGDWQDHESCGVALAERFLALPESDRPSAACILNDEAAQSFIGELSAAGLRVPQDFSVAGQDDTPIARLGRVPLTTVSQPVESIAQLVVELICSRLDGSYDGPPRHHSVRGELRMRQSVAPPDSI